MPKEERIWRCDACDRIHKTFEDAVSCEKRHVALDDLAIVGFKEDMLEHRVFDPKPPVKIEVWFKKDSKKYDYCR